MTGAIRNTASSAFYGSCQSQFRIRVSLTLPNDVTKCSISPPLRQNGLANLGWIIAGWNLSISIALNRVHFQFPRFTLLKATTGQWWMMVVKRWIRWFWIERRDIRVSFFSDIEFFRDKNFHVHLTRLNSRFPRNTTNVTNYLKSILKLFLRSNVVSSLRNDWKNVFFNFY